jgi:hypothetical protein
MSAFAMLQAKELQRQLEHLLSPEFYHNDAIVGGKLEPTLRALDAALPRLRQGRDTLLTVDAPRGTELAALVDELEVLRTRATAALGYRR